jgi:hypothetical protein
MDHRGVCLHPLRFVSRSIYYETVTTFYSCTAFQMSFDFAENLRLSSSLLLQLARIPLHNRRLVTHAEISILNTLCIGHFGLARLAEIFEHPHGLVRTPNAIAPRLPYGLPYGHPLWSMIARERSPLPIYGPLGRRIWRSRFLGPTLFHRLPDYSTVYHLKVSFLMDGVSKMDGNSIRTICDYARIF